ncbi:ABC transporter ATP-binding protein [Lacinutrix sp. Hel_I_90]|uniref:ABC transporter ATP-binding protein n=1 Tax=Lacinutrix sp. Hel_I_90 TaxID=1249999 RepID=UPI0005CA3506|nr:ABC transporter ATP-binding protein [Lacinutrix sp. Hel_I_90]
MEDKDIILKAENVSKQYRLGLVGTGTISHDLNRWWSKLRGKEDPYLKVGESNDRSTKGESQYVWALKDISFEVKRGEVLGIIGKNGAGKSTLLKILSKVTGPTTGEIKTKGRIASLLEVGTGFHGEMTGRENVFLNGAILGMTKKEIASKIEEIIDFSGCQRYIDTPVKRYSSGMTVRLAFAVAAFLEPEILVIDEVLAVGDAEFQKKAIGKMQDISRGEGRTVLFVSHNMAAIKNLCTRCLVLEHGKVVFEGDQNSAVDFYTTNQEKSSNFNRNNAKKGIENVFISDIRINNRGGEEIDIALSGDEIIISLQIEKNQFKEPLSVGLGIYDINDSPMIHCSTEVLDKEYTSNSEQFTALLKIKKWPLSEGEYYINAYIRCKQDLLDHVVESKWIRVEKGDFYNTGKLPSWKKGFFCDFEWN